MYCPLCGEEMEEMCFDSKLPEPNWAIATKIAIEEWVKKATCYEEDEAVRLVCNNNGCFGEGFELLWHHPLRGMKSKPGDSWSLTWLK